jgi:hypothetical protein
MIFFKDKTTLFLFLLSYSLKYLLISPSIKKPNVIRLYDYFIIGGLFSGGFLSGGPFVLFPSCVDVHSFFCEEKKC